MCLKSNLEVPCLAKDWNKLTLAVGGGVGGGVEQLPNVVVSLEAKFPPALTSTAPSQITLYAPFPKPQQMPSP